MAKQNKNSKRNQKFKPPKIDPRKAHTLNLKTDSDVAMDFGTKVYKKFNKLIKSIVLFGSSVKKSTVAGSDIDIIVILDDITVKWDQALIAWYRIELEKIMKANPYKKDIHVNTIKLSTWWEDLIRGDPVIINVIRYGQPVIDFGGFFEPLKYLLENGKMKSTPETIYNLLSRAPKHYARSKVSELNAIEGLYWAMVDSSHAALIAAGIMPPSPEHVASNLKDTLVSSKKLKMKYVIWYRDLHILHKKIAHGEVTDLKGVEIDEWQERTKNFIKTMAQIVDELVNKK